MRNPVASGGMVRLHSSFFRAEKLFMIIFCLVESVKQFVLIVLICWINEQDKILAFHQEGFVQNEFTDRDELRCFLLAVSGIYRIQ